jgi:NADH:ubiquinone oxidoreductase subunit 3 (subunit A)
LDSGLEITPETSLLVFKLIFWFIVAFLLVFQGLASLPKLASPKELDIEKGSVYECGFEPFHISAEGIEIHFLVVALLFIIFDLEIIFLVPLILTFGASNSLLVIMLFLYCLGTLLFVFLNENLNFVLTWIF